MKAITLYVPLPSNRAVYAAMGLPSRPPGQLALFPAENQNQESNR